MDLESVLLAMACIATAVILVKDARRALRPRLAGEQPWRRRRVAAITAIVLAVSFWDRAGDPSWVSPLAMAGLIVGAFGLLRCSIALGGLGSFPGTSNAWRFWCGELDLLATALTAGWRPGRKSRRKTDDLIMLSPEERTAIRSGGPALDVRSRTPDPE
jgi:hypothetical protein